MAKKTKTYYTNIVEPKTSNNSRAYIHTRWNMQQTHTHTRATLSHIYYSNNEAQIEWNQMLSHLEQNESTNYTVRIIKMESAV